MKAAIQILKQSAKVKRSVLENKKWGTAVAGLGDRRTFREIMTEEVEQIEKAIALIEISCNSNIDIIQN